MLHHHFQEIDSTQDYLKNEAENNPLGQDILVSCETQTHGKGQHERKWDSFDETLCFSILLKQNEIPTLTSLEMACLIHKYFQQEYKLELTLKWPNDILTPKAEKVAGLILNSFKDAMAVGIGINYFENQSSKDYKTKYGFLFEHPFSLNKKDEAHAIAMFCLRHRMNSSEVRSYWSDHCIHLNKPIVLMEGVTERKNEIVGVFLGIGNSGEAIIKDNHQNIKSYFSGTVSIRI